MIGSLVKEDHYFRGFDYMQSDTAMVLILSTHFNEANLLVRRALC